MTVVLGLLLFASLIFTFLYIISATVNALAGSSFIPRLLIAVLFFLLDLILADALNMVKVF